MSGLKTNFIFDGKKEQGLIIMTISYGYKKTDPETGKNRYPQTKISTEKRCLKSDWQKYKSKNAFSKGKVLASDLSRFELAAQATYSQFM